MDSDLVRGRLVPVVDALEEVLSFRPSPACAWRLHAKGVQVELLLPDGRTETRRVKLATLKFAGRRLTSVEAVRDFIAATNPARASRLEDRNADEAARLDERLRSAGLLGDGRDVARS